MLEKDLIVFTLTKFHELHEEVNWDFIDPRLYYEQ